MDELKRAIESGDKKEKKEEYCVRLCTKNEALKGKFHAENGEKGWYFSLSASEPTTLLIEYLMKIVLMYCTCIQYM